VTQPVELCQPRRVKLVQIVTANVLGLVNGVVQLMNWRLEVLISAGVQQFLGSANKTFTSGDNEIR